MGKKMILLALFAFLAGLVTILSPCILPILPIVLSSSIVGGKRRPIGVVTGFIASFTFFTLFLTSIVKLFEIDPESLRLVSVVVIAGFGVSLLFSGVQALIEKMFGRLSSIIKTPSQSGDGFWGGVVVGLSIGLIWTPCVGPILASVISLALTGTLDKGAVLITLSYALGTAIPMLLIVYGGRRVIDKVPLLTKNTSMIQKIFGVLMIMTSIMILNNWDRRFQTYILNKFPSYGAGLTKLEEQSVVQDKLDKLGETKVELPKGGKQAPEIIPGGEWINLPPGSDGLRIEELRGKVVLVDFFTYTCINCIRTLPYLKSWDERYREQGLVIIGVHTPEFEFEKDLGNVKQAAEEHGLEYPIVQDNNFATWWAYNNRYWPAKYLIDKEGVIRYTHFGEGKYDETEDVIRELLIEAGAEKFKERDNNPVYEVNTRTPETYLGYGRMQNFASPERVVKDGLFTYTAPSRLRVNEWAAIGSWKIGEEEASAEAGGELVMSFDAQEVYLVMRSGDGKSRVEVALDEQVQAQGEDNVEGVVQVDEDRLYHLISLPERGKHVLRLKFIDSGTEVFAFTFG